MSPPLTRPAPDGLGELLGGPFSLSCSLHLLRPLQCSPADSSTIRIAMFLSWLSSALTCSLVRWEVGAHGHPHSRLDEGPLTELRVALEFVAGEALLSAAQSRRVQSAAQQNTLASACVSLQLGLP